MTSTHALVRVDPFAVIELYTALPYRLLRPEIGLDSHLPPVGNVPGPVTGYRLCTVTVSATQPSRFHSRIGETYSLSGNVLTATPQWEVAALDDVRSALKAEIDMAAGAARSKYITVAPGQDMTYREKIDEARAYHADESPDPADYPILMAEVGATAPTIEGVVSVVLNEYAAWKNIGAQIEGMRMHGKKAVDDANDVLSAIACVDALEWP